MNPMSCVDRAAINQPVWGAGNSSQYDASTGLMLNTSCPIPFIL